MSDAFADLGDLDRWVAWRNEKRGPEGKPTKVPYGTGDRRAKADVSATWISRHQAEAAAKRLVNGAGGGIGIELGDLGHDVYLAGIDLDTCLDSGGLAAWAGEILAAFPSYAERSPSGTGVKGFAFLMSEHVRPFLDRLGVESTGWGMRRSVGETGADHGPAVEFYTAKRYFAVTSDQWPGQPDRIALLGWPALERLAALVPPRSKAAGNAEARGDDSRSAIAFRKGRELRRDGASFEEMVEALRQDPETNDWVKEKGDAAGRRELRRIWEKADRDQAGDADTAEIARLARLSALAYEREREAAAERLGCRTSILDRLVRKERGQEEQKGQGRALQLDAPDPWPEAVDGTALLADLSAAIRRHVVLEDKQARTVALWVLAAHSFDAFVIFPRLLATAPEKGCGKSTLLDLLGGLIPKPLKADSITAAALFRVIEAARPSMLLDEADAYLKENEDLRAVINAGHRRDGAVIRTVGEDHEPRQFSAWAPMAIAAIGRLPPTIEDRSIAIRLKRRRPEERIESLRQDRTDALDALCRMCARWAADHAKVLAVADPAMPEGLINRAADNWRPLLAVADIAGAAGLARLDAAEMVVDPDGEQSARLTLLGDLRDLFDKESSGVLFTAEILKALNDRDDRPWSAWGKAGKGLTGAHIGSMLKHFGISTGQAMRRGIDVAKGYKREAFDDAFARYL